MLNFVIQENRTHYATVMQLAISYGPVHFITPIFLCTVCFYLGHTAIALFTFLWFISSKACTYLICKRSGPFESLSKDHAVLALMVLFFTNALILNLPGLCLAAEPSIAMKVTAVLWILGAQVYVMNTWSSVPTFAYSMLPPVLLLMVFVFFRLGATTPVASSFTDWSVTFTFVAIFIFITIDSLREQLTSKAALLNAEQIATSRLSQLKETQRRDGLTGLLNRPAFDVALQIMLNDKMHSDGEVAVLFLDLNDFKPINDTYSHEAGDRVLAETATRLQMHVGDMGIVGRHGGDEFICAVQLDEGMDVLAFADTLNQSIDLPILWRHHLLKVTASIGIATTGAMSSNNPNPTVPALRSAADQAMFAAKFSPNRAPVLYEAQLSAPHMTAEDKQALADGIADETVKPYYQPKIHLQTGQIIGFEALARWETPKNSIRSPGDFLDQINDLGLRGDFTISIVTQVFRDVEAMLKRGLEPGQISLNVPEIVLATFTGQQDLHRIVAARPAVTKHITFEVTEDVFNARASDAIQASIASFRDLGLRISLDDFGTGHASFNHLNQLDFDELKIDKSIVSSLGHDTRSEVLVKGFLDIASGLGVSVIAEGVETQEQSQQLINIGCTVAQGFLYSEALPFNDAAELLEKQQTT